MEEGGEVITHDYSRKTVCLTFDVEDWFQVENLREKFPPEKWNECEMRVVQNSDKILDLLDRYNIKATFFVLGFIAERFPELIKKIHSRGHEIASHGYSHTMNYALTDKEIFEDIKRSKQILEEIINDRIIGYRAPSFSVTEEVLNILHDLGFIYDSSYHPFSKHQRYGKLNIKSTGQNVFKLDNGIIEFSLPVIKLKKIEIPIGGAGYFRLYPLWLYKTLFNRYLKSFDVFVMYFHPWEFDPDQPRISDVDFLYKFRHYVGLRYSLQKLEKFIRYLKGKQNVNFCRIYDLVAG